jgi:hypothetical protein
MSGLVDGFVVELDADGDVGVLVSGVGGDGVLGAEGDVLAVEGIFEAGIGMDADAAGIRPASQGNRFAAYRLIHFGCPGGRAEIGGLNDRRGGAGGEPGDGAIEEFDAGNRGQGELAGGIVEKGERSFLLIGAEGLGGNQRPIGQFGAIQRPSEGGGLAGLGEKNGIDIGEGQFEIGVVGVDLDLRVGEVGDNALDAVAVGEERLIFGPRLVDAFNVLSSAQEGPRVFEGDLELAQAGGFPEHLFVLIAGGSAGDAVAGEENEGEFVLRERDLCAAVKLEEVVGGDHDGAGAGREAMEAFGVDGLECDGLLGEIGGGEEPAGVGVGGIGEEKGEEDRKLQIASGRLQLADCKLQIANIQFQVGKCARGAGVVSGHWPGPLPWKTGR